jgi:hypothetical protein
MIDPNPIPGGSAEQAIDRHIPELSCQIPQRDVNGRYGVDHQRSAAHVTMSPIQFLPEVLNPRWVFAIDQLEQ